MQLVMRHGTAQVQGRIKGRRSNEKVEGLPTNAPLQHSYNFLRTQVVGHSFVLIRVVRGRQLTGKGSRSTAKASNAYCTVTVGTHVGETEVVEGSNTPNWGRQFTFPLAHRLKQRRLRK